MGTATSKARAVAAGLAAVVLLGLAACGGKGGGSFAWLRPSPPPSSWSRLTIPTGAALAYPATWQRVHSDPGTVSVVRYGVRGTFLGYLNVTPRQGSETLANYAHFRVDHNGDEGDRSIRTLATASGLRFRTGHGTCVKDSYTTATGAHYVEVACLVAGARATSVIVAAAPPDAWRLVSPQLEHAIESFTT